VPKASDRFLVISDLQLPFTAPDALAVCKRVQRHFRIPSGNVLCVGDELDQYHGSSHPKSPDATLTPSQELKLSREMLKDWYRAFPEMKLAVSNHGIRWVRKAAHAEIPSELLRCYREIIEAPKGWVWKDKWTFKGKHPFRLLHGMGYSGVNGHRNAAMDAGMSTVIGHLHSFAAVSHIVTEELAIWGMNVGSLIDAEAFAFEYGRYNRNKSVSSLGVILDGGSFPLVVPAEAFS
jgi:hypothetical protein